MGLGTGVQLFGKAFVRLTRVLLNLLGDMMKGILSDPSETLNP